MESGYQVLRFNNCKGVNKESIAPCCLLNMKKVSMLHIPDELRTHLSLMPGWLARTPRMSLSTDDRHCCSTAKKTITQLTRRTDQQQGSVKTELEPEVGSTKWT